MSMETLLSVPQNVAVEAGYLAIRVLKHRAGQVVAADAPFGDQTAEASELAKQIIHEISSTEHRPVARLDRARVDYYISKIAEIVQTRVRDNVGIDAERGDALLAQLRADDGRR